MSNPTGSKEKILLHARELFYFEGYQATSVDDILRHCGVAKSNFYYHFKTKDDLGLAVLDQQIAEFEAGALSILGKRDEPPARRLERFCRQLLETQARIQKMGGCPFGNLAAALSSREEDARSKRFRETLCALFHRIEAALSVCLQEGIEAGVFRSDIPARQMATTLLAAIEGLMLLTKTRRSADALREGLTVLQMFVYVR
jgi:TetR/AcrR family transcriptional repressor of nem operon